MDLKKLIIAVVSFLIWPVGIALYFVYKSKKDAQLFGLLGLIGLVLTVLGRLLSIF